MPDDDTPIYEVEELFVERRVKPGKHFINVNGKMVECERRKNSYPEKSIAFATYQKLHRKLTSSVK